MKKSVRKRRKVSGIVLKKTGNDFILTKQQFFIWGLGISFFLILLAFSVDYFSNSASYGYGLDEGEISGVGKVGELYASKPGDACGKVGGSGEYKGCGSCLTCDNYVIFYFTAKWCGPCQTFKLTQDYRNLIDNYPVIEIDMDKNPKYKQNPPYVKGIPAFDVYNLRTKKWVCDNGPFVGAEGAKKAINCYEGFSGRCTYPIECISCELKPPVLIRSSPDVYETIGKCNRQEGKCVRDDKQRCEQV